MSIDIGKILRLSEISDYQDNSIVSRTIINTKSGTVTLFAFDKGQGLSKHSAPYDALLYLLEGKAEVNIDGNKNILQKGELIIMPADIPHAIYAIEKFKMILILIGK